MVDRHAHGCPEPEVLAAYVDRGLSLTERARVDAHLASCPQCIALVAGVARTVAEVSALMPGVVVAAEATPLLTRRSLAGALATAAAVFAIVLAPSFMRPWLERDAGLVSLVDSVGEHRSVLGRLTGGFPHAPLGVPSAGGQDGRAAGTDRVHLTAGKIRESFGERRTASQLHALGISELLTGRYDDAAQSLLAASREQPANAQYLSDVAAVQLERARLGLRPDDLPRALAAADRARRLDPSLKEAWFNRALALSALSLTSEAKAAWTDYLKQDSTSPWAAEARARLEQFATPTAAQVWSAIEQRLQSAFDSSTADEAVRKQTTEARHFIENTLLVNWANAVLEGGGGVELDRLRIMSQAMLRVAGDALYADQVSAIDRATPEGLLILAGAHRDYADAAAHFSDDQFNTALPGFTSARRRFGGSPFALLAAMHEGAIAYVTGRSDTAAATLNGTLETARAKRYSYISGRSSWFLGLIAMGQSRFADAQSRYEDTVDAFTRMGDVEQAAGAHSLLAALYDYLGDAEGAWRHRLIAFKSLSASRSPKLKALVLGSAGPAIRIDSPETALAVHEAALSAALEGGRESSIADILAQKTSLLVSLNRPSEAAASARQAREHLARVSDPALRSRVEVALLLTESDLKRRDHPAAAADAATQAIQIVQQRRDRLRIAQLNLRLAQANIVWGRTEEARVALNRGLEAFNEERAASTEQRPISALDESWQLFDASVQLSLKEKDYPRAFALSEAARSRSASEASRFGSVNLQAIQAALGPDEAIVALNQFETQLAVWLIRRNDLDVSIRSMSRETAAKLVARQQDEIWQQAAITTAGRELYNEILRPLSTKLSGISRLILVPDPTFEDTAFAALYNSERRRYLIEDVSVRLAPSAAAFAISKRLAGGGSTVSEPLIFGGSNDHAASVASAYRSGNVVVGGDATEERFFADAAGRRIVHIEARTSANRSYPLLSRLVVAGAPGARRPVEILGSEIAKRTMPQTRLVVIDEAAAASTRGEGTLSMARAFMAAGVPAVLGTLPGADESATRDLMIGFHREMSQGMSAEQALSTVQRNALQQNGRRLGAWTALVIYGSDR